VHRRPSQSLVGKVRGHRAEGLSGTDAHYMSQDYNCQPFV
jgi:hypothetical protein